MYAELASVYANSVLCIHFRQQSLVNISVTNHISYTWPCSDDPAHVVKGDQTEQTCNDPTLLVEKPHKSDQWGLCVS